MLFFNNRCCCYCCCHKEEKKRKKNGVCWLLLLVPPKQRMSANYQTVIVSLPQRFLFATSLLQHNALPLFLHLCHFLLIFFLGYNDRTMNKCHSNSGGCASGIVFVLLSLPVVSDVSLQALIAFTISTKTFSTL